MKIVAISDLHGYFPSIEFPSDILIIAGDIVPLLYQMDMLESKRWFENDFAEWIKSLPVEEVIMIPGNHDFYFENILESNLSSLRVACHGKLKILLHQKYTYIDNNGKNWLIFGTPYCHYFGNWAFERDDAKLKDLFKEIPDNVDIIISHDPPFNFGDCDINYDKFYQGHLGNRPLAERLKSVNYKILFCGHIHSGSHQLNRTFNTINVSLKDEKYKVAYLPFYIELT